MLTQMRMQTVCQIAWTAVQVTPINRMQDSVPVVDQTLIVTVTELATATMHVPTIVPSTITKVFAAVAWWTSIQTAMVHSTATTDARLTLLR